MSNALPFILGLAVCLPSAVSSQVPSAASPSTTPVLDYGPHDVGFSVIAALDSTRAFRPRRNYRGAVATEPARPVQVSLWYPSRVAPDAPRMVAGDFRVLQETEVDFARTVDADVRARLRDRWIRAAVSVGADSTDAVRLWDGAVPIVRDGPPLPGPYPTVLYLTSAGTSNPLLAAYLASHGFVVASFPSNGRMTEASLEFTPNALTLDTDIDDAGFAFAVLRRLPWADTRRLAVASFSSGSLAALLWQMRDMQASAIVALEGWERYRRGADIIAESVHFEPHRVRVPFLMIERAADETSAPYAKVPDVVGALPYTEITRVSFRDAAHVDFLSHVPFGHTSAHAQIFESTSRMVRLFLETHLEGDAHAARTLAGIAPPSSDPFFAMTRDPAIGPVPTEEELYRLAETDPTGAVAAYREAKVTVPGNRLFREAVLTRAAVFATEPAHRVTILEMVADAYPASLRARFGLGQALETAGRTEAAVAEFEAALDLLESLPTNDRAEWRDRIESAIAGARRGA